MSEVIDHDQKTGPRDSPLNILTGIAWGRARRRWRNRVWNIFLNNI